MKDFWQNQPKPIIGLAPMDGYTDSAFRRVCKLVNPTIVTFTEFISSDGLHHSKERLKKKFCFYETEKPLIAQIFGKKVATFIEAAKILEDLGFSGIDLNMGCPAKNVVKSEHGMALRKNWDLAFELIEAVASSTSLPVSVKTRLGWSDHTDLIPFCLGAINAGANLITIHGRTFKEPYKVPAHFEPIYELKKVSSVPIIGNGGILSFEDGMQKLGNLDGFLIGQASLGNPWVFVESKSSPQSFAEKIPIIKEHARFLIEAKGVERGVREIRKFLLLYTRDFYQAKQYRKLLTQVNSLEEIYHILDILGG
ncbi:MAG: tRNA-dihydrouridine synthase [Candidatus Margulisiibacteriota bacterium]|jgi:tRNA-dihydrouridine synthase B